MRCYGRIQTRKRRKFVSVFVAPHMILQVLATIFWIAPQVVASFACDLTVPIIPGALHTAVEQLAALNARSTDSDTVICLEPGNHVLETPVVLSARHNRGDGHRVIWVGDNSTLSAGVELTQWMRCVDGVHCNWPEWNGGIMRKYTKFIVFLDLPPFNLNVGTSTILSENQCYICYFVL